MNLYADFRDAVLRHDHDAAVDLFSADCTFLSPIVHQPYVGREPLRAILGAVGRVFEDFRYTAEYAGEGGHVLVFACRVGERSCEGVDILRSDGEHLTDLTVMVRPYSAATLLRERMAAALA